MAVVARYIISLFMQNAIGHNAISLHKVLTLLWAETDNFGTQLREIGLRQPGPIPLCKIASSFYRTDRPGRRRLTGFCCKNQDAVSFESFPPPVSPLRCRPGGSPLPHLRPKKSGVERENIRAASAGGAYSARRAAGARGRRIPGFVCKRMGNEYKKRYAAPFGIPHTSLYSLFPRRIPGTHRERLPCPTRQGRAKQTESSGTQPLMAAATSAAKSSLRFSRPSPLMKWVYAAIWMSPPSSLAVASTYFFTSMLPSLMNAWSTRQFSL